MARDESDAVIEQSNADPRIMVVIASIFSVMAVMLFHTGASTVAIFSGSVSAVAAFEAWSLKVERGEASAE